MKNVIAKKLATKNIVTMKKSGFLQPASALARGCLKPVMVGAMLAASGLAGAQSMQDAQRPSYDYVGLSYLTQNLDEFDCDQDGLVLDASFTLTDGFYVKGNYSDVSGDGSCGSSMLQAGVGYRHPWGDYWHMYGVVSFADRDDDVGGGDSGPVAAAGIRGFLSEGWEGWAELGHSSLGDGELSANVGGAYHLTSAFAVTGGVGFSGEQNSLSIGGRYHF